MTIIPIVLKYMYVLFIICLKKIVFEFQLYRQYIMQAFNLFVLYEGKISHILEHY